MNRYALHSLIGLNVLLALALAALWVTPDGQWRNLRWQAPEPQATDYAAMLPAVPLGAPVDTSQFIAMLERPLFSITRRPPPPLPPPKTEQTAPTDTLSTARLLGVFTGNGDGGVILDIGGKPRRVRIREQIDGWTLDAVQERGARFVNAGNSRTLPLQRGALTIFSGQVVPSTPSAPPPAAVAPPAAESAAPQQPASAPPVRRRPAPSFGP